MSSRVKTRIKRTRNKLAKKVLSGKVSVPKAQERMAWEYARQEAWAAKQRQAWQGQSAAAAPAVSKSAGASRAQAQPGQQRAAGDLAQQYANHSDPLIREAAYEAQAQRGMVLCLPGRRLTGSPVSVPGY